MRTRISSTAVSLEAEQAEWQTLVRKQSTSGLDPADSTRMIELDERRRRYPSSSERLLPTRLGNRLRAAEDEPKDRYGLDAVLTWAHLWLLLPETARAELVAARSAVDRAVAGMIWSALFLLFGFWTLWALPAGLVCILLIATIWLPTQVERYATLIPVVYDLYRFDLYKAAHWQLPTTADEEVKTGPQLTAHLYRGETPETLLYDHGSS